MGTSATFPTVPSSVSTCATICATNAPTTVATLVSIYAPTTTSDRIGPSVALLGSFFDIVVVFCHEKKRRNVINLDKCDRFDAQANLQNRHTICRIHQSHVRVGMQQSPSSSASEPLRYGESLPNDCSSSSVSSALFC